ncbi:chaperone modulator CbpM [uncultured Cardiobacterium sp.]|uniref:chaperone modulator CbpM n=1 Tax=uncultured Cardiobacterium sp. TaxID=417619 RepID=UPI0026148766|nr:chaperone modulator CbpM [uncultured Cardiobacterium sp.]
MHDEHDIQLSYREIIRACDSDDTWFTGIIEADIIHVNGDPQQATYSGYQLARLRRARRISRDFEASAPATALILQLLDELDTLRKGR